MESHTSSNMIQSLSVPTTIAISALSFCAIGTYYCLRNNQKFWERKGIKGPKPDLLIGNLLQKLLSDRTVLDLEWVRKYGKIYGVFYGLTPRLVIADPDVLLQMAIKDFEKFQNRELSHPNSYNAHMIFFIKDDHWKKVRSLMTPTFTSGKIKRMFKLLDSCADDLVECFRDQVPKSDSKKLAIVNLKETYNMYTIDAITTCCYGIKLERASGTTDLKTAATRNDFVKAAMRFFGISYLRIACASVLPKKILRKFNFQVTPDCFADPLASRVQQIINSRRKSTKKFNDYLQLLIDARLDAKMDVNDELDEQENHHAALTQESILNDQNHMVNQVKSDQKEGEVHLDDLEVLGNAIFLLAVGLETTGSLLAHCSYALAFHQDIQQRLYEEIEAICEYNEDKTRSSFDYDTLTSCKYLDAVISETLRRLSPVVQMDRVASSDYTIEKYNIHIKQGQIVNYNFYAVMNDPDYWEKPEIFNPERFMPENKDKIVPGSYCPFGLGPRYCIGMRFSLTEAKLALAKILMNYRFKPAPGTVFPPKCRATLLLNNVATPLVELEPRV